MAPPMAGLGLAIGHGLYCMNMYVHTDILLEKGGGVVPSLHTPQLALDDRVEARKVATYIPTAQTSLTIITQL